jgi:mono/diheme cytochrome c family protein
MLKSRALLIPVLLLFLVAVSALLAVRPGQAAKNDLVERGRYLVTVAGCNDCHSPKNLTAMGPVPDETRLLSGHPQDQPLPAVDASMVGPGKWMLFNDDLTCAVGPWGASFAANLTPDKETGIGAWPEEMFVATLRNGKHLGSGRPLLPPMPWPNLAQATDEDLKAMFAYLRSIPPVKNQVPAPIPPDQLAQLAKLGKK